jgi:hypothetical protein
VDRFSKTLLTKAYIKSLTHDCGSASAFEHISRSPNLKQERANTLVSSGPNRQAIRYT